MNNLLLLTLLCLAPALAAPARMDAYGSKTHGPPADIDKACATAKDKDFCVKNLKAHPKSQGLDIKEITFLSMEIAQNKSTDTNVYIDKVQSDNDGEDDTIDDALNDCDAIYDDTTAQIENAMSSYFDNNYKEMRKFMKAAIDLAGKCQESFKDDKVRDVMGDRNPVFIKMCQSTLALIDAWEKSNG